MATDVISQPDYIKKSKFNEQNKTLLGDLGGWERNHMVNMTAMS